MKQLKLNETYKLVLISTAFTLFLLALRVAYTGEFTYLFYPWNLFLAFVPLLFSRLLLKQKTFTIKSILLLAAWLLFLPNAPYLVTDIFHFTERPPMPMWFDLMIVVSGAWNGILFCMMSLFHVERFFRKNFNAKTVNIIMFLLLLPCGYGIYIGRYLRYNSWDVVTDPFSIIKTSTHHLHHPLQSLNVWLFTFVFATFLGIIYFTIKKLPQAFAAQRQF